MANGSAVELQAGDGDIRLYFFTDSHYGDPLEAPRFSFASGPLDLGREA